MMDDKFIRKARRIGKLLNWLSVPAPRLAGRITFRLFCTPRAGKLREKDIEYLEKASSSATFHIEEHFIRFYAWKPTVRLEAAESRPRTVLLVHGWESNAARWRKFIRAFRDAGFEVWALDAPAHGGSSGKILNLPLYCRVLKGVMEKNGVPDLLVGHSLGGAAVVMSMAAYDAPRPKKAAILGVFAESARVIRDFGKFLGLEDRVLAAANRELTRFSGMPIEAYSVKEKAKLLTELPGLVLHDADDHISPSAEGRAVAAAWGAQYVETAGFGHRMQDKTVVELVLEFAQSAS